MNLVWLMDCHAGVFPQGTFTFTVCDQLHLYCKTKGQPQLEWQAQAMVACSSLPVSVFLFDTQHQVNCFTTEPSWWEKLCEKSVVFICLQTATRTLLIILQCSSIKLESNSETLSSECLIAFYYYYFLVVWLSTFIPQSWCQELLQKLYDSVKTWKAVAGCAWISSPEYITDVLYAWYPCY